MKRIYAALVLLLFTGVCLAETGAVVLIGHFSNQKVTRGADPHFVSGYDVSLYQSGETLFGDIGVATGAPEPESARLYDITFDPATKRLEFKAKYSGGYIHRKKTGPGRRESRVLLIFSGTLTDKALAGTMVVKDGYSPEESGEAVHAVMKRVKSTFKPNSLEKWSAFPFPVPDW